MTTYYLFPDEYSAELKSCLRAAVQETRRKMRKRGELLINILEDWPPVEKILFNLTSWMLEVHPEYSDPHPILVSVLETAVFHYESTISTNDLKPEDRRLCFFDHERLAAFIRGILKGLHTSGFLAKLTETTSPLFSVRMAYNRLVNIEIKEYLQRNHHEESIFHLGLGTYS